MHTLLFLTAILVAGTLTGNELAVSAFVHPQIARLDDAAHARARQAFARLFGKVMPFWYALTLVLSLAVAWNLRGATAPPSFPLAITSAALWFVSIVYTLVGPVPINTRISQWNLEALPLDWQAQERAWDRLHAARVVILCAALVCLVLACLKAGLV